jgi:hypothetical protein
MKTEAHKMAAELLPRNAERGKNADGPPARRATITKHWNCSIPVHVNHITMVNTMTVQPPRNSADRTAAGADSLDKLQKIQTIPLNISAESRIISASLERLCHRFARTSGKAFLFLLWIVRQKTGSTK